MALTNLLIGRVFKIIFSIKFFKSDKKNNTLKFTLKQKQLCDSCVTGNYLGFKILHMYTNTVGSGFDLFNTF